MLKFPPSFLRRRTCRAWCMFVSHQKDISPYKLINWENLAASSCLLLDENCSTLCRGGGAKNHTQPYFALHRVFFTRDYFRLLLYVCIYVWRVSMYVFYVHTYVLHNRWLNERLFAPRSTCFSSFLVFLSLHVANVRISAYILSHVNQQRRVNRQLGSCPNYIFSTVS